MNPFLVVALLPLGATAPSSFYMSGMASMEACEYARGELVKQHAPFNKKIVLWSACVPNGPAATAPVAPHSHQHKD